MDHLVGLMAIDVINRYDENEERMEADLQLNDDKLSVRVKAPNHKSVQVFIMIVCQKLYRL